MRKTILSVLLVLGLLPMQADENDFLWLHSPLPSATRSYAIDDLRKITFGGDALQIHLKSQSSPIAWAYSDLLKMTFETKAAATAVKSLSNATELSISQSLSEIRVESPTQLKHVVIYNLQGYCLALFGQGSTTASFSLKTIPAGVYIIRAENAEQSQTIKFVNP